MFAQQRPSSGCADATFAAIKAGWGVQKFGAMFVGLSDVEYDAAYAAWDRALSGFEPHIIESALAEFVRAGDAFPPNLPPLVAACRMKAQAAHRDAPQLPPPRMSQQQVQRNLHRVNEAIGSVGKRPAMFWATAPKSAVAVRTLIDAAQRDSRLLEILREHDRNGASDCRSDEAAKALRGWFASAPAWYRGEAEHV